MSEKLTADRMASDVADMLQIEVDMFDVDDNLVDWGLDSIRLMTLVQRWTDAGAAITFAEFAERPQLSHWWTIVSSRAEAR